MNPRASLLGSGLCWSVVLLCWLGLAQGATADDASEGASAEAARAGDLLARMADAVSSLSYEGTLVYLHEDRLEALSLMHRVEQGQVQERLISLSGPVQVVARQQGRVMCVLPDGHPISVEREGGAHFLETDGIDPAALVDHYAIRILGMARVAGRDTDVVGIIPRDALRYGYRFHIDRETALPLKSDLIDEHQEPLEQLMFTTISLWPSDGIPPSDAGQPLRSAPATTSSGRWRFDGTPAGFELVMHHQMPHTGGAALEHFLFTDRLSAYSVYIEQDTEGGLSGVASIGAVHAAGRVVDGYQVTAVGEVPEATVQAAIRGAHLGGGALD